MENGRKSMPRDGLVSEIRQNWAVFEDEALATKIQQEEVFQHYNKNRHRNQQIREDIPQARQVQSVEESQAEKERVERRHRMMQLSERDELLAKELAIAKNKDNESQAQYEAKRDELFAKNLQRIEQEYVAKHQSQNSIFQEHSLQSQNFNTNSSFFDQGSGLQYNEDQYQMQVAQPIKLMEEPMYQNVNGVNFGEPTESYLHYRREISPDFDKNRGRENKPRSKSPNFEVNCQGSSQYLFSSESSEFNHKTSVSQPQTNFQWDKNHPDNKILKNYGHQENFFYDEKNLPNDSYKFQQSIGRSHEQRKEHTYNDNRQEQDLICFDQQLHKHEIQGSNTNKHFKEKANQQIGERGEKSKKINQQKDYQKSHVDELQANAGIHEKIHSEKHASHKNDQINQSENLLIHHGRPSYPQSNEKQEDGLTNIQSNQINLNSSSEIPSSNHDTSIDSVSGGRSSRNSTRSRSSTTSTSNSELGADCGLPSTYSSLGACGGAAQFYDFTNHTDLFNIGEAVSPAELKAAEAAERLFEQERKDLELARQLQEQLSVEGAPDALGQDQKIAVEAQDREFAQMLEAKEKAKVRRAKEKARQRKLERQQMRAEAVENCEEKLAEERYTNSNREQLRNTELMTEDDQEVNLSLVPEKDQSLSPRSPRSPDIQPPSRKPYIHAEAIDSHTNDTYCLTQITPIQQQQTEDKEPHYANIGKDGIPLKEEPILHIPTSQSVNGMHSPRQPSVLDTDMPVPPYMPMQTSTTKKSASLERRIKKKKEKEGCKQQ